MYFHWCCNPESKTVKPLTQLTCFLLELLSPSFTVDVFPQSLWHALHWWQKSLETTRGLTTVFYLERHLGWMPHFWSSIDKQPRPRSEGRLSLFVDFPQQIWGFAPLLEPDINLTNTIRLELEIIKKSPMESSLLWEIFTSEGRLGRTEPFVPRTISALLLPAGD